MDNNKIFKRRGRGRMVSFNPSHEFIADSVQDFLNKGGKIKRIERVKEDYDNLVTFPDAHASADDFLFDR